MRKLILALTTILLLSNTIIAQNALHFDGVDDYTLAPGAGPTGTAIRTVEALINMDTIIPTQMVIVNWGDMTLGQRFTLNIIDGYPRIEIGGEGVSSTTQLSTGTWYHIAATYDHFSSVPYKLYVDGILVASGAFTQPINTSSLNGIMIGRRIDGINHFKGSIDEVRVWDIARTQSQILADLNSEFCTIPQFLSTYYKFNQGIDGGNNASITTLLDAAPPANNSVLYNFTLNGNTSNWTAGKLLTGDSFSIITNTSCNSYTSANGNVYTTTGIYTDTLPNAIGCDSIITLDLTIIPVDTTISQFGTALQSNQGGAVYQWLDCSSGFATIQGANSQTYFPTVNGTYAAQVTFNGCTDTSECFTILNVGLEDLWTELSLTVSPNPANDLIEIAIPIAAQAIELMITDLNGKLVYLSTVISDRPFFIDCSKFEPGVYMISVRNDRLNLRSRFIKY